MWTVLVLYKTVNSPETHLKYFVDLWNLLKNQLKSLDTEVVHASHVSELKFPVGLLYLGHLQSFVLGLSEG